jgi:hypothetical protein
MNTKESPLLNPELLNERTAELMKRIAELERRTSDVTKGEFKFKYVNPYVSEPPRVDGDVAQEGPATPTGAAAVWLSYGG